MARDSWLDGVAVIRESGRVGHESSDQGEPWPWELGLNRIGNRKYDLTLEVTVPGVDPFLIAKRFKVPKKAENIGLLDAGRKVPAGVEVPVRVDAGDPEKVEIDWERWIASPGRKEAVKQARIVADSAQMERQLAKDPKLRAIMRDNNKRAVMAWAQAVQLGNLSREQFESEVAREIATGRMDPADADAARAALDGV